MRRAARPTDAREAAVALLARSDLSSIELFQRLQARGYPAEDIEAATSALRDEGLLDDTRYAHAQVLSRTGRGQGPERIRLHLTEAGLPAALIEEALQTDTDWKALAEQVRRRRFGPEPPDPKEALRQARFLQYRGFPADLIRSLLDADLDSGS